MFSQKFSRAIYNSLCVGIFLICHTLFGDLTVTIQQIDPVPALANCDSQDGVPVQVGGTVRYQIVVTNTGSTTIRGFSLDDTLNSDVNPNGVRLIGIFAECARISAPEPNSFHIDSRTTLAPGESETFTGVYRICTGVNAETGFSTLTNTATVTSSDSTGASLSATALLTSCVRGCALSVTVFPAVPTLVCSNGSVTLTASIANCCCPTIIWRDPNGNIIQQGTDSQIILSAAELIPGQYSVNVVDSCTNCQASGVSGALSLASCADLSITKAVAQNNDQITYTITVINNGPDASLVTVTDCLPTCLNILAINPLNSSKWSFQVNNNCITALLINDGPVLLQPFASASFEIVALKTESCGKSICNTATVKGSILDPNLSNNVATVKVRNKR